MVRQMLGNLFGEDTAPDYRCLDCGSGFDAPRTGFGERRCPECGAAAVDRPGR